MVQLEGIVYLSYGGRLSDGEKRGCVGWRSHITYGFVQNWGAAPKIAIGKMIISHCR
jgi:hypothetical protein